MEKAKKQGDKAAPSVCLTIRTSTAGPQAVATAALAAVAAAVGAAKRGRPELAPVHRRPAATGAGAAGVISAYGGRSLSYEG